MAIMQIGAQNVPIYPTIPSEDYVYIFNHAQCKFCFASDDLLYNKIASVKKQIFSKISL